jgi:HTH-type transcriptional regulator / antitoxin HigA
MKPKVLKDEAEYQAALAYVETLMDAAAGSPEEEDLELFAMLIEQYEQEHFPIDLPDPIEAIQFRMDQQGLTRKDLVPFIGSQSKVSEVLNKKRPLSLSMIRALNAGLGIPAEVLLQEPGKELAEQIYDPRDFPFTEMYNQGYFSFYRGSLSQAKTHAEELISKLFSSIQQQYDRRIFCRMADLQINENALIAWQARLLQISKEMDLPTFRREQFTEDFLRRLIHLSDFEEGPVLAQELLFKKGIPLIILPHLSHTYLDGACMKDEEGRPIIGMTLRHDRLDNFWFTLAHELAHIYLHLDEDQLAFFDETNGEIEQERHPQEDEADEFARNLLIPADEWERIRDQAASISRQEVLAMADRLQVSPAIVAGRIRWALGDFSRFSDLIGNKKVKRLFDEET